MKNKVIIAFFLTAVLLLTSIPISAISTSAGNEPIIENYSMSFSSSYKSGEYYDNLQNCYNFLDMTHWRYDYGKAVAEIAKSQVGYHESDSSDNYSGASSGTNNYTEYNRWYNPPKINQYWCNLFVSWCFAAAGLKPDGHYYPKNPFYLSLWRNRDAEVYSWKDYRNGLVEPLPGDVIIYGTSTTNNIAGPSLKDSTEHIGIIVGYSNGAFTTVEGNIGNKVGYRADFTPSANTGYVYNYTNKYDEKVNVYVHAIIRPSYNIDTCDHGPEYANNGYCFKCNKWLPNKEDNRTSSSVQYTVTAATTYMVQHPYAYSKDEYAAVGDYKPKMLVFGQKIDVYGYVINGFSNKWYYVKYNGTEGYIYYERLTCDCECSTSYAGDYTCTASSSLVIHSDHSWSSDTAIGTIPSGATCQVIKSDGKYAHIVYNGISGIVAMNYLKKKTGSSSSSGCDCTESKTGLYYCTASSALVIHSDHSYNSDTAIGRIPAQDVCLVTKKSASKTYTHIVYKGISGIVSWNYLEPIEDWSFKVLNLPDKTVYDIGDSFDPSGLLLEVSYSFSYKNSEGDYTTKIGWYKANSDYTLSGFSSATPGEKTITVKYGGKTKTFKVTVRSAHITNLSVYTYPSRTYYEIGETLDISGLRLKAIYSDGSSQIITNGYSVHGFDPYKCGTQDVEVEYDGLYTTFPVVVDAPGAPAEPGDPGEGGGYLPGDMDSDGDVDSDDAIYLLRHVLYPNDYVIDQNADIDGDGDVDSDDAIYLLRHVLYPDDYPL